MRKVQGCYSTTLKVHICTEGYCNLKKNYTEVVKFVTISLSTKLFSSVKLTTIIRLICIYPDSLILLLVLLFSDGQRRFKASMT